MNTEKTPVTVHKLAKAFAKIYNGLDKFQLSEMDKELLKIHPSDKSEVLVSTDYGEEENSMGVSIYVSKPLETKDMKPLTFDKLMFEYLIRADITKLSNVYDCISLMERKDGDKYEVDFIPVFYTKEIDRFDIHFRIIKK